MTVCGIVCEYDPFHLGHEKQLRLLRQQLGEDTAVIGCMSGNFTQRGSAAVFDKMTRARAAAACGVDLVVELPITGVLQSAEGFAKTGTAALTALGAEVLCFGCECGDAEKLMRAARTMQTERYARLLRSALEQGRSYAAARQWALFAAGEDGTLLRKPNDILALEYCKAIVSQKSTLRPLALLRQGDYHDELPDAENPSAAAIRKLILNGGAWQSFVPEKAAAIYEGAVRFSDLWGERAKLARLYALEDAQWQAAAHGSEGLWSKVRGAAHSGAGVEEILNAAKTKRYPRTRLQRLLTCACLGITEADLRREIPYLRVLAFDETGRRLLRELRGNTPIPLVNAGQRPPDEAYYALECRAARLYGLFSDPSADARIPCEQSLRFIPPR